MIAPRRDFLRGLVTLPLIGGSIALLGSPQAVAVEATDHLLFEYTQWLAWEKVAATEQLHDGWSGERGYLEEHAAFHVAQQLHGLGPHPRHYQGANSTLRSNSYRWHHEAPSLPSTRAALVMSAVGCNWREGHPRD